MTGGIRSLLIAWICMGIFFLRGLNRVSSARAFSTLGYTRRVVLTNRGGGVLLANSKENEDTDDRVPATGWNHNAPKSDSFWQSANGGDSAVEQQQGQEKPSDSNSLRTGWLHNTASPQKKEAKKPTESGNKAQQRLQQAMQQQERNHRIVSSPIFHACGNDRQIVVTEHRLSIPVYRPEKKPRIDLAFTIVEEVKDEATKKWFQSLGEMTPQQRATAYIEKAALENADEMMLYLQGGPGFGSPTPVTGLSFSQGSSWGAKALDKYKRVVLMDQRGTGKSTPITKQSLEERFPDLFLLDGKEDSDLDSLASTNPEEYKKFNEALGDATKYMASFRADNIVKVSGKRHSRCFG
jgi:hypothetical protein